jgi:hypothetical protein
MPFYRNRVYPYIVAILGNPRPVQQIRQEIIPIAHGTVLEVGVGPGVNFAYLIVDRQLMLAQFGQHSTQCCRRRNDNN